MNLYDLAPELADIVATAEKSCAVAADLPPAEAAIRLAEDGLIAALMPEPHGLDMPLSSALPVLRAAGAARVPIPLAQTLAASHLLPFLPEAAAEAIAGGAKILTAAPVARVEVAEGRIRGRAGHVPLADRAGWLVVPAANQTLALVERSAEGVRVGPGRGMDERIGSFEVDFEDAPAVIVEDRTAAAEFALRLNLFLAIYASAAAAAAMEMAIAYLSDRSQFGRPLIGFQTLRHDLARARMELHSLDRLIWTAIGTEDQAARADMAAFARARATAHCPGIAEMALHMHGGMGFTRLVPLHEWVRRLRAGLAPRGTGQMYEDAAARALAAV